MTDKKSAFPSKFAIRKCTAVGILPKLKRKTSDQYYEIMELLEEFQMLSIACSFKESMTAFEGKKFSTRQKKALKFINKNTAAWLKGFIVGEMTYSIQNGFFTGGDKARLGETIIKSIDNEEEIDADDISKKLIINVNKPKGK